MSVDKGQQFLEDEDGQLHFNFPDTAAHLSRMSRRRTFDLQPHEMSPEEFINHPDTLFHSSVQEKIKGLQPFDVDKARGIQERDYYDYPEIEKLIEEGSYGPSEVLSANYTHAGSEKAAYARADKPGMQGHGENTSVHIHAVHVPNKEFVNNVLTDDEANAWYDDGELEDYMDLPTDHPDKDPLGGTPWYYHNTAEDTTSLSAVIPRAHALTHADYVKQALEQGKGDEIHPETLKRYQQGTLSSVVEKLHFDDHVDDIDNKFKDHNIAAQLNVGGDLFTGIDDRHSIDSLRGQLYKRDADPYSPNLSYGYPKRVYGSSTFPIFETERGNLPYDNSWIGYKPEDEKNG